MFVCQVLPWGTESRSSPFGDPSVCLVLLLGRLSTSHKICQVTLIAGGEFLDLVVAAARGLPIQVEEKFSP